MAQGEHTYAFGLRQAWNVLLVVAAVCPDDMPTVCGASQQGGA
jgi:hypothetical protein